MPARVHVAVGVIVNPEGQVLLSRRAKDAHQGGLWEFPGGKVEAGEGFAEALARELFEELHIEVLSSEALLEVEHDYPDKSVLLEVHIVKEFRGVASGREGQPLAWVPPERLPDYEFPAANLSIVDAVLARLA